MEEAFARVVSDVSYKIYCGLLAEARFDAGHARDAIALGGLRARQQQV
jgi:hypothetical protein